MTAKRFFFEKIIATPSQKLLLFNFLRERKYKISHSLLPNENAHNKFVEKHPYREWYIVKENEKGIGSFYIQYDNSIGINLNKQTQNCVEEIIKFIKVNYIPQPKSLSKIPPYFYINIPSKNIELQSILEEMRIDQIQVSYKI